MVEVLLTIWLLSPIAMAYFLIKCKRKKAVQQEEDIMPDEYNESVYYSFDDLVINIVYVDAKKETTHRKVKVSSVDDTYVKGWCYKAEAPRTFMVDRIKELHSEDNIRIKDIMSFFKDNYEKSSDFLLMNYIDENINLLKVLIYLVKADGRYSAKEKVVVRKFLRDMTEVDFDDKIIDKIMKLITNPSFKEFSKYVDLLMSNDNKYELESIAKDIIGTGTTVHENEKKALDYIVSIK